MKNLLRVRGAVEALEAHPGFTGDEDTAATLAGAEAALQARERALADLLADVDLRVTLGADNSGPGAFNRRSGRRCPRDLPRCRTPSRATDLDSNA